MATPTRPCPYCGAAVLTTSPHCGNCGRPVPPAPQGPGQAAPAKTIFGYQAPKVPGVGGVTPGPAAPRAQTPVAGSPAGLPGPQRSGAGSAPGFGGGQPAAAPQSPAAYGQSQPAGYGQQQPAPGYGQPASPPPSAPPAYGAPPSAPPQAAPQGYGQPQQPPAAAPQAYGQPSQQQGYGAPPQQQGYPPQQQQPQGYGAPPQQQGGYPPQQQGGYPPQQHQQGGYPQQQGGGLAGFASRLPQSAPGTLFGIPLATLRDPNVERKALLFAGIALLASLAIPIAKVPGKTIFVFTEGVPKFSYMVWPILTAAVYLFIAAAPAHQKAKMPTVLLRWLPFTMALLSLGIVGWGIVGVMKAQTMGADVSLPGSWLMFMWGYPILIFGLLARLTQPNDMIARIIIGAGAFFCLFAFINFLEHAFDFKGIGGIMVIHNILFLLVLILAVGSAVLVPTPQMVPALGPVDAFAPLITAVLLLWVPVEIVLLMLHGLVHEKAGATGLFMGIHMLVGAFAYFGVLMLTAPEAYDSAKAAMSQRGAPPGGGYGPPPGGGGYGGPPQGGGYGGPPPQGGGYPPQGGGYPPQQGGGYPPQQGGGGGYPPQGGGGGGWPQQ